MKLVPKILLFILFPLSCFPQETRLSAFLKAIPGAEVTKVDSSYWEEFYVLMLPQPLDHKNPAAGYFRQRIFVGHRGFDRPTVMETEGYGCNWMNGFLIDEPATLLNANQLYVEHRYFGASKPEKLEWKYLNAEQDAGDYHAIRLLFGQLYAGKWITTGVSKGGQTAVEYKVFYPDDIDVVIPYVAPLNYRKLDGRIDRHFRKVGTRQCRDIIRSIQEYLLQYKKVTLPIYEKECKRQGYSFSAIDIESAFDYSVLELPFSFWQYTADCSVLPDLDKALPAEMVEFLVRIVNPFWFTDAAEEFSPANYQFYTQLGYYEYDEWPFRKYLKNKDYPNSAFVPKGSNAKWDGSYIRKLKKFIRNDPQQMIFIYGESDPWGATSAKIKANSGSLKMVKRNGTHGTNILSLEETQKQLVFNTLEEWTGSKIELNH